MTFDWWTLALQTINFVILVWLLYRFLYKPVLRMIDARRSEIDKQFAEAKRAEDSAKKHANEIELERQKIAAEANAAVKSAASRAEELARASRAQAQNDAAGILDDARKTTAKEREQALSELKSEILSLATDITRRLIARMAVENRADVWLDEIEEYVGGLHESDRAHLVAQATNDTPIKVLAATAWPEETTNLWRDHLHKLFGETAAIEFDADPALIAGVELHLPEAILRFSLQSALSTLQAGIGTHDDAGQ
jgi:F-type H+-transporting ATPase subunit b